MSKHTEGNWGATQFPYTLANGSLGYREFYVIGKDMDNIAFVPVIHPEAKANARLIAAAPMMYRKLKDTVAWLDQEIEWLQIEVNQTSATAIERLEELRDDLSLTIAKAKGE